MDNLIDQNSDRKYFTMLPNVIDDLDLSVIAFRLYVHYRRVAGENGSAKIGVRALAKKFKVGNAKIIEAKTELEKHGLITVKSFPKSENKPDEIRLVNIWRRNLDHFDQPKAVPEQEQVEDTPAPKQKHPCSQTETPPVSIQKQKNIEEEDFKEEKDSLSQRADAREENSLKFEFLDDVQKRAVSAANLFDLPEAEAERQYFEILIAALKEKHRLNAPMILPDESRWKKAVDAGWKNQISAAQAIDVYDLLEAIRVKKRAEWTISPELWQRRMGKIETLRLELENLSKEQAKGETANAVIRGHSETGNAGHRNGNGLSKRDAAVVNRRQAVEQARSRSEQRRNEILQGRDPADRE